MTLLRLAWRAMERTGWAVFVVAALTLGLHFALPGRLLLKPVSMQVDADGIVTLVRRTPQGQVLALYSEEVVGFTGETCGNLGSAPYEKAPKNRVFFRLSGDLMECAEERPAAYRVTWWPLLWDVFPLRPVSLEAEIPEVDVEDLVREQRVLRGQVRGLQLQLQEVEK